MIPAQRIVDEARQWLGTPYLHQGRSRFGVDCIGFAICVRNSVEPVPMLMNETRNYDRRAAHQILLGKVTQYCTPLDEPEQGCLILIKWPLNAEPSHVALHADGNILHAYAQVAKVVETGYRAQWSRDTHSLWRLPGVGP